MGWPPHPDIWCPCLARHFIDLLEQLSLDLDCAHVLVGGGAMGVLDVMGGEPPARHLHMFRRVLGQPNNALHTSGPGDAQERT